MGCCHAFFILVMCEMFLKTPHTEVFGGMQRLLVTTLIQGQTASTANAII